MSTITAEQEQTIRDRLVGKKLARGLGDEEAACSVAEINLALTGRLTDKIPECMSPAIGEWIIVVQDAMPDEIRWSEEWKALLPRAAGTGRDPKDEAARRGVLLEWMWGTVLPSIQPMADRLGFGAEWAAMCAERTAEAARAATWAAWAALAAEAWARFAPISVLRRMIEVGGEKC